METLSEFDNESPLYVSFCMRIDPEDFDRQSLIYTQKALQDLYAQMEQNPGLCASVVRKRKQMDNKDAGLVSYVKGKFTSLFHPRHSLETDEIEEEVKQLRREMQRVNSYACAAKKIPLQLLDRRARRSIALGKLSQTKLCESAMPKVFGPFPNQAERLTGALNMDWKRGLGSAPSVNPKSLVNLHPLLLSPDIFWGENGTSGRPRPSPFQRPLARRPGPAGSFQRADPAGAAPTFLKPRSKKENSAGKDELDDLDPPSRGP